MAGLNASLNSGDTMIESSLKDSANEFVVLVQLTSEPSHGTVRVFAEANYTGFTERGIDASYFLLIARESHVRPREWSQAQEVRLGVFTKNDYAQGDVATTLRYASKPRTTRTTMAPRPTPSCGGRRWRSRTTSKLQCSSTEDSLRNLVFEQNASGTNRTSIQLSLGSKPEFGDVKVSLVHSRPSLGQYIQEHADSVTFDLHRVNGMCPARFRGGSQQSRGSGECKNSTRSFEFTVSSGESMDTVYACLRTNQLRSVLDDEAFSRLCDANLLLDNPKLLPKVQPSASTASSLPIGQVVYSEASLPTSSGGNEVVHEEHTAPFGIIPVRVSRSLSAYQPDLSPVTLGGGSRAGDAGERYTRGLERGNVHVPALLKPGVETLSLGVATPEISWDRGAWSCTSKPRAGVGWTWTCHQVLILLWVSNRRHRRRRQITLW